MPIHVAAAWGRLDVAQYLHHQGGEESIFKDDKVEGMPYINIYIRT